MKCKQAHGLSGSRPWDAATFRRHERAFPRWRTEGPALCAAWGADLVVDACVLLLNEAWRESVREWIRYGEGAGAARRRRLLPRGKGRPTKPVLALLGAGGLRPATARMVAAALAALLAGERDSELVRREREREHWRRMVDSLVTAQRALKAQGLKRPHADQYALEREWRRQLRASAWRARLAWNEIQARGLNRLSLSDLVRRRNQPSLPRK